MPYITLDDQKKQLEAHKSPSSLSGHTDWLIIFADLLSLILAFFVLLFSMAEIPKGNWDQLTSSIWQEFTPDELQNKPEEILIPEFNNTGEQGLGLGYLQSVLKSKFAEKEAFKAAQVYRRGNSVVVSMPANVFFVPKTPILAYEAEGRIADIASIFRVIQNQLSIQSHSNKLDSDDQFVEGNWALTVKRSAVLAHLLKNNGYPLDIVAFGKGATEYDLLPDHLTSAEKLEVAERIDFVLADEKNNRVGDGVF